MTINQLLEYSDLIVQCLLVVGLLALAWVESRKPRIATRSDKWDRWQSNVALYVTGAVLMALAFDPLGAEAIRLGGALGWGGLAASPWPTWIKLALGVLAIDLFMYALHRLSHYVPWWWRLHKIHHCDTSMDASTALRHHPFETILNSFLLVILCAAAGMPLLAIMLYAVLERLHSLFCHANLALPAAVDRWLRLQIVTPDMHAIHHSIRMDEGNSNFGMIFPWWDRILRSYRAQPAQGREAMRMGIAELTNASGMHFLSLLRLPFRSRPTQAAPAEKPARRASGKGRR
jgi:sterol desaturase/sphingolipid hydroxylase (fatty acid hydroxylase superfamily)